MNSGSNSSNKSPSLSLPSFNPSKSSSGKATYTDDDVKSIFESLFQEKKKVKTLQAKLQEIGSERTSLIEALESYVEIPLLDMHTSFAISDPELANTIERLQDRWRRDSERQDFDSLLRMAQASPERIAALQDAIVKLQDEISNKTSLLRQTQHDISRLRSLAQDAQGFAAIKEELQNKVSSLEHEVDSLREANKQLSSLKTKLEESQETNAILREKLAQIKQQYDEKTARFRTLIQELQDARHTALTEKDTAVAASQQASADIEQARSELASTRTELSLQQNLLQEERNLSSDLEKILAELRATETEREAELARRADEITRLETELCLLQEESTRLRQNLSEENRHATDAEQKASLQEQEANARIEALSAQIKQLEEQRGLATQRQESALDKLGRLEESVCALEADLQMARTSFSSRLLEDYHEHAIALQSIADLERECSDLKEKLATLRETNTALTQERDLQTSQISQLTGTLKASEELAGSLLSQMEVLKSHLAATEQDRQTAERKLSEERTALQEQLKEKLADARNQWEQHLANKEAELIQLQSSSEENLQKALARSEEHAALQLKLEEELAETRERLQSELARKETELTQIHLSSESLLQEALSQSQASLNQALADADTQAQMANAASEESRRLAERISQLELDLANAQVVIETENTLSSQISEQLAQVQQHVSHLAEEREAASQRQTAANSKLLDLEEEIADLETNFQTVRSQLKDELAAAQIQISTLTEKLQISTQRYSTLEAVQHDLLDELQEAHEKRLQEHNQRQHAEDELKRAEFKLNTQEAELEAALEKLEMIRDQERRLGTLLDKEKQQQNDLALHVQNHINELRADIARLTAQRSAAETRQNAANEHIASLEISLKSLEQKLITAAEESRIQAHNDQLRLEHAQNQIDVLMADMQTLSQQRELTLVKHNELLAHTAQIEGALNEVTAALGRAEEQSARRGDENASLLDIQANLEREKVELSALLQNKTTRLEELETRLAALDSADKRAAELASRLAAVMVQNQTLGQAAADLAEVQTALKSSQSQLSTLTEELKLTQERANNLETDCDRLSTEKMQLEDQLSNVLHQQESAHAMRAADYERVKANLVRAENQLATKSRILEDTAQQLKGLEETLASEHRVREVLTLRCNQLQSEINAKDQDLAAKTLALAEMNTLGVQKKTAEAHLAARDQEVTVLSSDLRIVRTELSATHQIYQELLKNHEDLKASFGSLEIEAAAHRQMLSQQEREVLQATQMSAEQIEKLKKVAHIYKLKSEKASAQLLQRQEHVSGLLSELSTTRQLARNQQQATKAAIREAKALVTTLSKRLLEAEIKVGEFAKTRVKLEASQREYSQLRAEFTTLENLFSQASSKAKSTAQSLETFTQRVKELESKSSSLEFDKAELSARVRAFEEQSAKWQEAESQLKAKNLADQEQTQRIISAFKNKMAEIQMQHEAAINSARADLEASKQAMLTQEATFAMQNERRQEEHRQALTLAREKLNKLQEQYKEAIQEKDRALDELNQSARARLVRAQEEFTKTIADKDAKNQEALAAANSKTAAMKEAAQKAVMTVTRELTTAREQLKAMLTQQKEGYDQALASRDEAYRQLSARLTSQEEEAMRKAASFEKEAESATQREHNMLRQLEAISEQAIERVTALQLQIDELQRLNASQNAQNETLNTESLRLLQEKQDAERAFLSQLEEERRQAELKELSLAADYTEKMERLKASLVSTQQESTERTEEVTRLQAKLKLASEHFESLSARYRTLEKRQMDTQTQLAQISEAGRRYEENLSQVQEAANKRGQENEQLKNLVKQQKTQNFEIRAKNNELQNTIRLMRLNEDKLTQEATSQNQMLQEELARLRKQVTELNTSVTSKDSQIMELRAMEQRYGQMETFFNSIKNFAPTGMAGGLTAPATTQPSQAPTQATRPVRRPDFNDLAQAEHSQTTTNQDFFFGESTPPNQSTHKNSLFD